MSEQAKWFGHPRGLSTLFFTEMWERFSYYGMRAILVLYMQSGTEVGGLGWPMAKAGPIYGMYTAAVYLTSLPGGWVADRLLGQRQAVLLGGILIACGHLSLTLHNISAFYLGLLLIVLGTGLLKPNISTMVGGLYEEKDQRRDAGFSIFYMGINLGGFLAPLACGYLAQDAGFQGILEGLGFNRTSSWHWGFGAATVGMGLGIAQYILTWRHLGEVGKAPPESADKAAARRLLQRVGAGAVLAVALLAWMHLSGIVSISIERVVAATGFVYVFLTVGYFSYLFTRPEWTQVERKRLYAVPVFFLASVLFWAIFEQAGSTLNVFATNSTRTEILGLPFPSSWLQSVNSLFIIALAPVFARLWVRLGDRQPSSSAKFTIGLFFVGLGFLVMVGAALASGPEGTRVSPLWLVTLYLMHTVGELCLSPVGLSLMTKLSPAKIGAQVMGVWFLSLSIGNFVGGQVAGQYNAVALPTLFALLFVVPTVGAVLLALASRPIGRLLGGVR